MVTTHTIETRFHGRFLREERGGERFLVGFHGYAETADVHLAELHKIVGISDWSLVAIQALNRFYARDQKIVANWMTSQDRELAIADNLAYVRAVIDTLPQPRTLVLLGFSQGAAMAARAAAAIPCDGLIILGGDIPPDVKESDGALPPVLLARGVRDEWYSEVKFKDDLRFLEGRTRVTSLELDAGHEWAEAFREAAGSFLRETVNAERRTKNEESRSSSF